MATAPKGWQIGSRFTPKRGRSALPDLTIRQIYRPDRRCLIEDSTGERRMMTWADIKLTHRLTSTQPKDTA